MWQKVQPVGLPEELQAVTTAVWEFDGMITLGVMQSSFLLPPYVWAQVNHVPFGWLKKSRGVLDELQSIIHAPCLFAEVPHEDVVGERFLQFLNFKLSGFEASRKLYMRSLN